MLCSCSIMLGFVISGSCVSLAGSVKSTEGKRYCALFCQFWSVSNTNNGMGLFAELFPQA